MKKRWMLGILLAGCLAGGCGFLQKKDVPEQIEALLADKYGKSFSVRSVEMEHGATVFDAPAYHALASLENGDITFDVLTDLKITVSRDGYAKLLYEDEINEKVGALLEETDGLNGYSFWTRYFMEERAWSEEDALAVYFAESETWVNIELKTIDEEPEIVAERVYGLAELLKANGIPYSIEYENHEDYVYLIDNAFSRLYPFDELVEKLRRRR